MEIYSGFRKYEIYEVISNGELIFTAENKSSFFVEKVHFYNKNNDIIIKSKHIPLILIKTNYKLNFIDGKSHYLKCFLGKSVLLYNSKNYCVGHSFGKVDKLLVDNIVIGELKVLESGLSKYNIEISCDREGFCFIFSIMCILLYTFDVN